MSATPTVTPHLPLPGCEIAQISVWICEGVTESRSLHFHNAVRGSDRRPIYEIRHVASTGYTLAEYDVATGTDRVRATGPIYITDHSNPYVDETVLVLGPDDFSVILITMRDKITRKTHAPVVIFGEGTEAW